MIDYEKAKIDGDYLVRVTIGDYVEAQGKKLVTNKGKYTILNIEMGTKVINLTDGVKVYSCDLLAIAKSILNGKTSIIYGRLYDLLRITQDQRDR